MQALDTLIDALLPQHPEARPRRVAIHCHQAARTFGFEHQQAAPGYFIAPADDRQLPGRILTEVREHFHLGGAVDHLPRLWREGSQGRR